MYEIDSIGLTRLIAGLNRGEDFNGRPIDAPTSFFVGVAVNHNADDLEAEAEPAARRRWRPARASRCRRSSTTSTRSSASARRSGGFGLPLLVGVFPLTSYRLALRLHNEVPGIVVPQELQDALEAAGPDAAAIGMAHARELISAARERFDGVYVVAPYRKPTSVLELLV